MLYYIKKIYILRFICKVSVWLGNLDSRWRALGRIILGREITAQNFGDFYNIGFGTKFGDHFQDLVGRDFTTQTRLTHTFLTIF